MYLINGFDLRSIKNWERKRAKGSKRVESQKFNEKISQAL